MDILNSRLFATRRSPIAVALLLAIAMSTTTAMYSSAVAEDKFKELVTITGDHQKQQFVFGERVEINKAKVGDDIFAMGRDIVIQDASAKYIIAAGMSHSLSGITTEDLILFGGQMNLSGNVTDDIVAAVCPFCPMHGRLHLTKTTQIGDDARLMGRDISIDGRIGGNLYAYGQQVRLAGEVTGNAKIDADRIVLAPGARIGGDLLYAGENKPEVSEGAVVSGEIRQVETEMPFAEDVIPKNWIWYILLFLFGIIVAMVLLATALQLTVPGVLSDAASIAQKQPWGSLGRGLAVGILVPGIVALLMVTIVGAPIGIITIAAFVVLLALAFVTIAYCIGRYLRGQFGWQDPSVSFGARVLWTTLGILILVIVGIIPFVGWALLMLAMIAGLGAVVTRLAPAFRNTQATPA